MWRENFLDPLIARMRHRWMTDRQYRAAMSGAIAIAALLATCSCMGIVSAFANGALTGSGLGAIAGPPGSGSGGSIAAVPQFPTATVNGWQVPATPISEPVPVSQTPQPSPTNAPTPTPQPSDTPCPNCATVASHSQSPDPWIHCSGPSDTCDSIALTTTLPNADVTVTITFPNTSIQTVNGQITTDGQGNGSFDFALVGPNATGRARVTLTAMGGSVQFRQQYQ